jgi:hypothetical protein
MKLKEMIFKCFERLSVCYIEGGEADAGAVSSGPDGQSVSTESGSDSVTTLDAPAEPAAPTPYMGSKAVNPDALPLREFDRTGMSEEDIDKMLEVSEGSLFLSPEELAAKNKEPKAPEAEEPEAKETKAPQATDDPDVAAFVEKTGVTKEEFAKLPAKIQERLVDSFVATNEVAMAKAEYEKKVEENAEQIAVLMEDPVIAARIEERNSNKRYVASQLMPATEEELTAFDNAIAADNKQEARRLLDKMINDRAKEAVALERSVVETHATRKTLENKIWTDVIKKVGDLDPRLKIESERFDKLSKADTDKLNGKDGILTYCRERGFTLAQIAKMSSEELYGAYSKKMGWDKKRDVEIYKKGRVDLLKALKNPTTAKTLDTGTRSSIPTRGNANAGIDRKSLISEMADGNFDNYNRQLVANESKPEVITELGRMFDLAMEERQRKQ